MKKTREELEERLENLYKELGRAYYEVGINDPIPELLEQLDTISRCKDEITALTEEEAQRKAFIEKQKKIAESICLECDQPVPEGSNFCNHCGKPMPDADLVAEAVKALAEMADEENTEAETSEEKVSEESDVNAVEETVSYEETEAPAVYEESKQAEETADDPDATIPLDPVLQDAFKEPQRDDEGVIPVTAAESTQRFCKNCGHKLLPKHKFCPGCGIPVAKC